MLKIEKTEVVGWEPAIRGMRNPLESWDRSDSFNSTADWELYRFGERKPEIGPNDHDLMTRLRDAGTDHRKFMRFLDVYVDITAPLYWWKEFKTYRNGRKFGDDEPDICPIPDEYLEFDIEMNSCSTMHKIHSKEFTLDDFSHEHLMTIDDDGIRYSEEFPYFEEKDGEMLFWTPIDILNHTIEVLNFYRQLYLKTKDKKYWWQMIQLLPSSYNQKRTLKLTYEVLANMYKSRRNHKLDEWHTFCDWVESLPYSELITGSESKKVLAMGNALSKGFREGIESVQRAVEQMRNTDHSDISGLRVGVIGATLGALNTTKNPMPDMLEQKGYTRTIEDGKIKYEKREETSDNETDH